MILLDVFIDNGNIVLWCKDETGKDNFFTDSFCPTVYFEPSSSENFALVLRVLVGVKIMHTTKKHLSRGEIKVLEITFKSAGDFLQRFSAFDQGLSGKGIFYNADIPLEAMYLFATGLFPFCKITLDHDEKNQILSLKIDDDPLLFDYDIPPLKVLKLKIFTTKKREITSLECNGEIIDRDIFSEFHKLFTRMDPDVLVVHNQQHQLLELFRQCQSFGTLNLHRFGNTSLKEKEGYSFFSYGVRYFRESPLYVKGRFLVNSGSFLDSSFTIYSLIEGARVCRMQLQVVASHSVGRAVTNLLNYTAYQKGYLIPYKIGIYERIKPFSDLVECDRGALTIEPIVGIHHDVAELDFVSMYPAIISTYNLSPETLYCSCCADKNIIGTPYHFCTKEQGIVPLVCDLLIRRRAEFKKRKDYVSHSKVEYLKWLLVVIFGFQAYRNKKIGCIEVHEAINALARYTLMQSIRICENIGYELVHAIVDSLYVKKKNITVKDAEHLALRIAQETQLPIEVKSLYEFITFLPSVNNQSQPVPTTYYGMSREGTLKVRGIAVRRRNTPCIVKVMQEEVIKKINFFSLNNGGLTEKKIDSLIFSCLPILKNHLSSLDHATVDDLSIKVRIGKENYHHTCPQKVVKDQLLRQGVTIRAGHSVKYIIENAERQKYVDYSEFKGRFDREKYEELLKKAFAHLFLPFGMTMERLDELLCGEIQTTLFPLLFSTSLKGKAYQTVA